MLTAGLVVVTPYDKLLSCCDVVAVLLLAREVAGVSAFLFRERGLVGAVFFRDRLTVSSSDNNWTVGVFCLVAASCSLTAFEECSILCFPVNVAIFPLPVLVVVELGLEEWLTGGLTIVALAEE